MCLVLSACVSTPDWRKDETQVVQVRVGVGPGAAAAQASGAEAAEGLDGVPLRVLLRKGNEGLKVSCAGGLRLRRAAGGVLADLPSKGRARLEAVQGNLRYNGRDLGVDQARITALRSGDELRVAGRRYRGRLWLRALGDQLAVIDQVGVEDYLKGVLPSEVPPDWPAAALQAQAVAARSFALARAQKAEGQAWDLDDSTASQVYHGADGERDKPSLAVDATRGRVLIYRGAVIEAFFHSNSGGHTADAGEVWGGETPAYLLGVMDTASEDQPHYAWSAVISREEVERRLERAGLWKGYLEDVVGRERSDSGRWTSLELLGHEDQRRKVSGNQFRLVLGADRLKSTRFRVRLRGDDLVFDGLGWGHGVGMSQEGALVMARSGRDARSILEHYYPGTQLARVQW